MLNDLPLKHEPQQLSHTLSYFEMLRILERQHCPFFLPRTSICRVILPAIFLGSTLLMQAAFSLVLVSFVPACEAWHATLSAGFFFLLLMIILIARIQRFNRLGPIKYLLHQHSIIVTVCGKDSCPAANSLICIGLIHELLHEPERALESFQSIHNSFSSPSSKGRGRSLLQRAIGRALVKLDRFPEALEVLKTSVGVSQLERKSCIRFSLDLHTIADIYNKMGDLQKAVEWRQHAWNVTKEEGNEHSLDGARCLVKLATTYEISGDTHQALKHAEQAMSMYLLYIGISPRSLAVARLYAQIGNLRVRMGHSGINDFRQAAAVFQRRGMSDEHPTLVALLGERHLSGLIYIEVA